MSKREAKKLMINFNLIDKMKILQIVINEKYCDENENDNKEVYKVGAPTRNDKSRRFEIL